MEARVARIATISPIDHAVLAVICKPIVTHTFVSSCRYDAPSQSPRHTLCTSLHHAVGIAGWRMPMRDRHPCMCKCWVCMTRSFFQSSRQSFPRNGIHRCTQRTPRYCRPSTCSAGPRYHASKYNGCSHTAHLEGEIRHHKHHMVSLSCNSMKNGHGRSRTDEIRTASPPPRA